jgi:hypothetical protein
LEFSHIFLLREAYTCLNSGLLFPSIFNPSC